MGGFILVTLLCSLCKKKKKISLLLQEGISETPEGKMGHGGLRGERAVMKVMGVSVAGAEPGCEEGLAAFPGQGGMGWGGFGVGRALGNYRDLGGEKYQEGRRDV